jgi:hypothetical protein
MDAGKLSQEAREHFGAVRKSVAYLQQLSDGLHLLALDPAEDGASGETTDLAQWWEQVGPLLRRAAPKHAEFTVDIPDGLPRITVAPHRLTQAILNLVVNAGEAIPKQGGRIKLWAQRTGGPEVQKPKATGGRSKGRTPSPVLLADLVRIGLTDNGHGMSEEVKRHALDPFFTTKKRGLGTGLGLALVQGVATTAGGTVGIESQEGKGTTVQLEIPVAAEIARPKRGTPTAAVSLQDQRIASFVCTFLRAAGVEPKILPAAKAPGPHACWITEATPGTLAAAKEFLADDESRCVVAIGANGRDAAKWKKAGAVTLEGVADFENFRRVMGEAIAAATGAAS